MRKFIFAALLTVASVAAARFHQFNSSSFTVVLFPVVEPPIPTLTFSKPTMEGYILSVMVKDNKPCPSMHIEAKLSDGTSSEYLTKVRVYPWTSVLLATKAEPVSVSVACLAETFREEAGPGGN